MIISGQEIQKRINQDIIIQPFNRKHLNVNSYNLSLHCELLVYNDQELDMKHNNSCTTINIPEKGLLLEKNKLYLGRTIEYTETYNLVPMLEGRSSIGRLGLFIHITAGFGDVGFRGYWTLEIMAVHPIRIYAGIQICQIFYHTLEGTHTNYVSDKYQDNKEIQPSMLYKELHQELP